MSWKLQGLLALKQQQASIVEAKAALERADDGLKQGKSIMAFTIMTIIFVSLATQPPITPELTVWTQDTTGVFHVLLWYEQLFNGSGLDVSMAANPHNEYVAFELGILKFSTGCIFT